MNTLVSISSATQFDICHRSAYYQSPTWGLGYSPVYGRKGTDIGSLYHNIMALHDLGQPIEWAIQDTAERQSAIWDTYQARPKEGDDILETSKGLALAHIKQQSRDSGRYSDKYLEIVDFNGVPCVEQSMYIEIDGLEFVFKLDKLVRHKDSGLLFPFEYKTSTRPEEMQAGLPWDLQNRFYCYAVSQLFGEPVKGVIYQFVRAFNPTNINILKPAKGFTVGLPSTALTTLNSTTSELYFDKLTECIVAGGYDPATVLAKYRPILEKFKTCVDPMIWRHVEFVSPEKQNRAAKDMVTVAREMLAAKELGADVRPSGLNRSACNAYGGCPFKQACLVHDEGGDFEEVLRNDFIKDKMRL